MAEQNETGPETAGTSRTERIVSAFERSRKALELRPTVGQGTARTRVHTSDGFTCHVEDGPWKLTVDMPEKHGGADAGPNPGVLGRAALGTCLAMSYVRWAALRDVPIEELHVDIEADYDARGELGVAEVRPGYSEIRYNVHIESDAPGEAIRALLDEADACTPFLDMFANAQKVRRVVTLNGSTEAIDAS